MVSGTLMEHATENKQAAMTTHSTAFIVSGFIFLAAAFLDAWAFLLLL